MTAKPTLPASDAFAVLIGPTEYDRDVLQNGAWTQETIEGLNGANIPGNAFLALPQHGVNLLTNGGFDLWQRGTSFTAGSSAIATADAWAATNGTVSLTTTPHGNLYTIATGAAQGTVYQIVYEMAAYAGKTVSVAASVYGAGAVVTIQDGTGTASSSPSTAPYGYTTIVASLTLAASATQVTVVFTLPASTFYYLDWATLTATAGPVDYTPLDPAVEWARARRRYAVYPLVIRFFSAAAGEVEGAHVSYPPMLAGGTLAITVNGGPTINNIGITPTVSASSLTGVSLDVTATAATTDTYIVAGTILVDGGLF